MIFVGPGYINENCLPLASDIFYHGQIVYFLPTGFHPIEIHSIVEFPGHCARESIPFPAIFWEMFNPYFENSKVAKEALEVIEPLRRKYIKAIMLSYPRGKNAINETKELISANQRIYESFKETDFDIKFIARELLSHLLFEVFIEDGFNGVVKYLRENTKSPDDLFRLIAAVMINRLIRIPSDTLLLYEHNYLNLIEVVSDFREKKEDAIVGSEEGFDIEHFRYKLFETLLIPIYGRCDTKSKSEYIAKIADKKAKEIEALKRVCLTISREVVLLSTNNNSVKQTKLSEMVTQHIEEPLGALIEKKSSEIKKLLADFMLDSTLIAGLLTALQTKANIDVVGTAAMAGALSTGIKYLLNDKSKKIQPSTLLVEGMQKARVEYEKYEQYLRSIAMEQLIRPSN